MTGVRLSAERLESRDTPTVAAPTDVVDPVPTSGTDDPVTTDTAPADPGDTETTSTGTDDTETSTDTETGTTGTETDSTGSGETTGEDDVVIDDPITPPPEPPPAPAWHADWVAIGSVGKVVVVDAAGTVVRTLKPYGSNFTGGIFTALGDVNGDGVEDLITGAANGGPHVKVFDGTSGAELGSFYAYDASFAGGVRVSAGDFNNDGKADIVTAAGPGGGPHVKVFDAVTGAEIRSFFAYDASFRGGVWVATGDTDGDGTTDIVTGSGAFETGPGPKGIPQPTEHFDLKQLRVVVTPPASVGTHVKVFSGGNTEVASFFAFPSTVTGGVRVATLDADGDGVDEVLVASGFGSTPEISRFDGRTGTGLTNIRPFGTTDAGGVFLTKDSDGDIRATTGDGKIGLAIEKSAFLV